MLPELKQEIILAERFGMKKKDANMKKALRVNKPRHHPAKPNLAQATVVGAPATMTMPPAAPVVAALPTQQWSRQRQQQQQWTDPAKINKYISTLLHAGQEETSPVCR